MNKIAIDLTKYDGDTLRELTYVIDDWPNISIIMVMEEFTKHDLKDMILRMEDEEGFGQIFIATTKGILNELKRLLELNQGRADGDYVSFVDTRNQTALDQFFEVYE